MYAPTASLVCVARKGRQKSIADEVADLVAGRTRLPLEKLVELINSVNPTERGLSSRESDERYKLKGQLQSLLIREHCELVRVSPFNEGTVGLSLDGTGRQAAHARLDFLDDDARSWVQHQLDAPTEMRPTPAAAAPLRRPERPPPQPPPLAADDEVGAHLAAASAAMESYDYETARAHYEAAARSSPSPEPHRQLLALLVDVLVADADALTWEEQLPSGVIEHASVRLLLGTAHARAGSTDRALALLRDLDLPDAAVAWVELAARLIAAGDDGGATRATARARSLDPAVAGLTRVTSDLEQRRAAAVAATERDLEALVESGAADAVVRERANAVRIEFPESRRAGAHLRRIESAARERVLSESVASARELATRATNIVEIEQAIDACRAAERAGAMMAAELATLRARHEALRDEVAVVELTQAFARDDANEAALQRWIDAPASVRQRVHSRASSEVLSWLAALDTSKGSDARRGVRAVLDLRRAHELQRAGRIGEAQALLETQASVLRSLPAATTLQEQLSADAAREIVRIVDRALDAMMRNDLDAAERALRAVDRRVPLTIEAREHLALADRTLRTQQQRWKRGDAIAAAVAQEDYFEARRLAREELAEAPPDCAAIVERRLAQLEETLAHQHSLLAVEDPGAALDGRDLDPDERTVVLVDDDGKRAVVASFYASWVFLRVLELDRAAGTGPVGKLVRGISFNARRLLDAASVHLTRTAIVVVARDGARISVSWDGSTLCDFAPALRGLAGTPGNASILPGGGTLLVQTQTGSTAAPLTLHVVTAAGRVTSKAPGYGWLAMHPGANGVRIWGATENTIRRLDESGQPVGLELRLSGRVAHFLGADEDDGLWVLWVEGATLSRPGPRFGRFDNAQKLRAELVLHDARAGTDSDLAAVPGGCFVLAQGEDAVCRLWAMRDRGTALEVSWAIDVPARGLLASSMVATGAWLLICSDPLEMWALSLDAPPSFAAEPADRDEPIAPSPSLFSPRRVVLEATVEQRVRRASSELGQLEPGPELLGRLRARLKRDDVESLRADALVIASVYPEHALACFERARVLAPSRADLAREQAQILVAMGRYADAVRVAEAALASATPEPSACALPLAVARYVLGQPRAAQAALAHALASLPAEHEDRATMEAFAEFLEHAFGANAERYRVGRRVRALDRALELRASGDLRGAIDVADVAAVWCPRDHAVLAVVSNIWLEYAPSSPAERLRRRLVLLAHAGATRRTFAPLVLEGHPLENLANAQDRVRRHIDETGGG